MVSLFHYLNLYLKLAGWSARLVKSCDRGLENAALALRPRAAFSSLRSQFFAMRTDPKPFLRKLAYRWICLRNFLISSAYAPSKEQIYFELHLVHQFSSQKLFFSGMKFRAEFEVLCIAHKNN